MIQTSFVNCEGPKVQANKTDPNFMILVIVEKEKGLIWFNWALYQITFKFDFFLIIHSKTNVIIYVKKKI